MRWEVELARALMARQYNRAGFPHPTVNGAIVRQLARVIQLAGGGTFIDPVEAAYGLGLRVRRVDALPEPSVVSQDGITISVVSDPEPGREAIRIFLGLAMFALVRRCPGGFGPTDVCLVALEAAVPSSAARGLPAPALRKAQPHVPDWLISVCSAQRVAG